MEAPAVMKAQRKQVKKACTNCRRAKIACSNCRPCLRCVSQGKETSCRDLPRKQRERRANPRSPVDAIATSPSMVVMNSYHNKEPVAARLPMLPSMVASNDGTLEMVDPRQAELLSQNVSLANEVQRLNTQLEQLHQTLAQHSFYYHTLFASQQAVSYWKIHSEGYCVLIDYTTPFKKLLNRNDVQLEDDFPCYCLYNSEHHGKTSGVLALLGSGRVESITVKVLWASSGVDVPVFCTINVHFNEMGVPTHIQMISQTFDAVPSDSFFQAISVKLRGLNPPQPKHAYISNQATPAPVQHLGSLQQHSSQQQGSSPPPGPSHPLGSSPAMVV